MFIICGKLVMDAGGHMATYRHNYLKRRGEGTSAEFRFYEAAEFGGNYQHSGNLCVDLSPLWTLRLGGPQAR
jgi:hypothetical protein